MRSANAASLCYLTRQVRVRILPLFLAMKTYTTQEIIEAFKRERGRSISRQRLAQLRSGYRLKQGSKTYEIKPRLEEGVDWVYDKATVAYTQTGLKKILER